jgi:single-strand DNA-binding protein
MAGSVNKVILVGNIGRDPEIRTFANGGRVANFSIATTESWKDKQTGERRERTEWHRISVINEALVGVTERYLRKGSKVYLEGRLETRKFTDQSGQERFVTEVILAPFRGELVMLDSRQDGNRNSQDIGPYSSAAVSSSDFNASVPSLHDLDLNDEIPF